MQRKQSTISDIHLSLKQPDTLFAQNRQLQMSSKQFAEYGQRSPRMVNARPKISRGPSIGANTPSYSASRLTSSNKDGRLPILTKIEQRQMQEKSRGMPKTEHRIDSQSQIVISQLKNKVAQLEKQRVTLKQCIALRVQDLEFMHNKMQHLGRVITELMDQNEEKERVIEQMNDKHQQLISKMKEMQESQDWSKDHYEKLIQELRSYEEAIAEAELTLEQKEETIVNLEAQLRKNLERESLGHSKSSQMDFELHKLRQELSRTQQEVKIFQDRLEYQQMRYEKLEDEVQTLRHALRGYKSEVSQLKDKIKVLKHDKLEHKQWAISIPHPDNQVIENQFLGVSSLLETQINSYVQQIEEIMEDVKKQQEQHESEKNQLRRQIDFLMTHPPAASRPGRRFSKKQSGTQSTTHTIGQPPLYSEMSRTELCAIPPPRTPR